MFPLLVNLTGRPCAVIGSAAVGQRKAPKVLDSGDLRMARRDDSAV